MYSNVSALQSASARPSNLDNINLHRDYSFVRSDESITSSEYQSTLNIAIKMLIMNRFLELKDEWLRDTAFHSSLYIIYNHPAYRQIIAMGQSILTFIFYDLRDNDNFWFEALTEITNENVITPEMQGNFSLIKNAWLRWGEDRGLI